MEVSFETKVLKLKETFSISYGSYDFRNALLVKLSAGDHTGYGECVEISYYNINLGDFINTLNTIKPQLENLVVLHPFEFYDVLMQFNMHPFLLSALDCAYWDLYGKLKNQSFCELNNIVPKELPESTLTISIEDLQTQLKKIKASSWKNFKVKCKAFNLDQISFLLEAGKNIGLDANTSFSDDDCLRLERSEVGKKLLFVEQPRPIGKYKILNRDQAVNWLADEDFQNISMLESLRPHYQSINIKLMKCGGLTPALDIVYKARSLGFKILIGCMTESSVGISAGIALSTICDYADLDGANLVSNDYAKGSHVIDGSLHLCENPGLGIALL